MAKFPRRAQETRAPRGQLDELTATLSRRAFIASLRARMSRPRARVLALCIADVDHFKNINLSHGPTRGDVALRDVAQRLVRTIRDARAGTLVGRYDGDAFALLVEAASCAALTTVAESLRRAAATAPSATGLALTVSIGAAWARVGEPVDALLVRAEQALYLAKQFGRDRVEIAPGRGPLPQSGTVLPLRRSA